MGITVSWDDQAQTVLRLTYSSPWTWEDYYTAMNSVDRLMEESGRVSAIIDDFTASETLPFSKVHHIEQFGRALTAGGVMHILVSPGALWRSMRRIIEREFPNSAGQLIEVNTLNEARSLLEHG